MEALTSLLNALGVGDVDDADELEKRLAEFWSELDGSGDGGMAAHKLVGRMEQVRWNPPILQFVIERHGGTMCGSTRAELQQWEVDFDNRSARVVKTGHRQLYRMASRISNRGIAAEIVEAVVNDQNDSRVQRLDDGRVKVVASRVFPNGSGFKRTLLGRRKKLLEYLDERFREHGWSRRGANEFVRANNAAVEEKGELCRRTSGQRIRSRRPRVPAAVPSLQGAHARADPS